jgi:NitT/TauT family transport system substrate-binding protein
MRTNVAGLTVAALALVLVAAASLVIPATVAAQTKPVEIRLSYIAPPPNDMMPLFFQHDFFKQNLLKEYGKKYTVSFVRVAGSPGAATAMAAGEVDVGTLSFPVVAQVVLNKVVPGGISIIMSHWNDAVPGFYSDTLYVLNESPIKTFKDLRGKKIAINEFGSFIDVKIRIMLLNHGLDPLKDLTMVEVPFPAIGPAIREKRVDTGTLAVPFNAIEENKGGVRPVQELVEGLGPTESIPMAARSDFLKKNGEATRALLADYVAALQWSIHPANREKVVDFMATMLKTPRQNVELFATGKDHWRNPQARVELERLQKPIDAMLKLGLIKEKLDIAPFIDLSYLPSR